MKKRILSILLAFAVIAASFTLIPAKTQAAQPSQIYVAGEFLYDGNEHMWREVGNGWSYDQKTNTLYLHGSFNYQYMPGVRNVLCCVLVEGDINIVVDGPTLIHLGNNGLVGISVTGNCNLTLKNKLTINGGGGINVSGKLTVKGQGSNGKYVSKPSGHLYGGICAKSIVMSNVKGIKINTPTLFGIHTTGGSISIKNCKMNVTGYTGGIVAFYGNVKISGKNDITAKANAKGAPAIGVVTQNKTGYIGSPAGKGKGKIILAKKVKVTTPVRFKGKTKSVKKTFTLAKGSTNKITLKYTGLSDGKIISKIRIRY